MDLLSETVNRVRMSGQLYGRLEFAAPWGFRFPGDKGICLMVTHGSCLLGVDDEELWLPLAGGDFVFLSAPRSYSLCSASGLRLRPIEEVTTAEAFRASRLIRHDGNGGARTSLIAGCFLFATPESEWLARCLPPLIHVSTPGAHSPQRFQALLQMAEAEIMQGSPGASAVVDRLAEILFVHALRTRITSPVPGEKQGWLRGLAEPQLAEALRLMHTEPDHPWTVTELARRVSMSRSAFATRFKELVGTTPLLHLTEWRMVRAAGMLKEGRPLKLPELAAAVGYESESAFSKAFKRAFGVPPARYRTLQVRER